MTIEVSSASCEQGNYFRVTIDGKEVKMGGGGERGIGLVIVEKGTRKVNFARMFDTSLDPNECAKLNTILLQAIPGNLIILGVKDDGSRSLTLDLIQTITSLGSKYINQLSYRDSWAFVARKGKPHSAREVKDDKSSVNLTLTRKPRLRHLLLSSASFDVGNYFSLTINDQAQQAISYNKPDQRGIVMIVLDNQGKIIFNEIFDTYSSSSACQYLEEAIKTHESQSLHHLMILAVKDEGSRSLSPSTRQLISSLGSKEIESLGYRESWCFLYRIGRPRSVKEGRHSSHPVTLSWFPKRLRLTHPPHQRYTIHFHPPNPSFPLPSLQSNQPSNQIPSTISHLTHPPLPTQTNINQQHHPPSVELPLNLQQQQQQQPPQPQAVQNPPNLTEGETLLRHRAKRNVSDGDKREKGDVKVEGKEECLKGGGERGREKEKSGEKKEEERKEHSPEDLYHHSHPYSPPPRPTHQEEEKLEKFDIPPVQSVHYRQATTATTEQQQGQQQGQGVDIGMSVRNNRARRRDTFS